MSPNTVFKGLTSSEESAEMVLQASVGRGGICVGQIFSGSCLMLSLIVLSFRKCDQIEQNYSSPKILPIRYFICVSAYCYHLVNVISISLSQMITLSCFHYLIVIVFLCLLFSGLLSNRLRLVLSVIFF